MRLQWVWTIGLLCLSSARAKLIDLSYAFDNTTHYWLAAEVFNLTEVFVGVTDSNFYYESYRFAAQEHGGTHLDAPVHFHRGGWSVADIPPERFIAHAAVVDISERAAGDPDAVVTVADLQRWQSRHGAFQFPTVVLLSTGYARRWADRHAYFGTAPGRPSERHFPGLSGAGAEYLAADPAVVGTGIDTASIDPGRDALFPAHRALGASNIYILENLRDLSAVPEAGGTVIAFPMKITDGSGAPCRVMVQVPNQ